MARGVSVLLRSRPDGSPSLCPSPPRPRLGFFIACELREFDTRYNSTHGCDEVIEGGERLF
jgi:hypothetical protein